MNLTSQIIITQNPDAILEELEAQGSGELFTIIKSLDDKDKPKEFLIEHAQLAIEKAYIASDNLNYIILMAPKFSNFAQNRLLKILEEPPRNKVFILITQSKSALLATVQSRMPVVIADDALVETDFSLDLENLNLAKVYAFVQEHSRISSPQCRVLVEQISLHAMHSKKYTLDESTLELFSHCIKALEVGSPTSFVLNTLLLKLLAKKK